MECVNCCHNAMCKYKPAYEKFKFIVNNDRFTHLEPLSVDEVQLFHVKAICTMFMKVAL